MTQVPGGVANFSIPGSGKTTMTYAVYDNLKSHSIIDQLFVVGPLASFKPWEEEFSKCFDKPYEGNVLRYVGKPRERQRLQEKFDEHEVILTNLPIVNNDYQSILANLFHNKKGEQKKMMEQMEVLKDQYLKEINKKSEETSKDDSGDVPFTLGPESIQPTKM